MDDAVAVKESKPITNLPHYPPLLGVSELLLVEHNLAETALHMLKH